MAEKIFTEKYLTLITNPSADYELLDSGDGEKLERFGNVILARPDPQALWSRRLPPNVWGRAAAHFLQNARTGRWNINAGANLSDWTVKINNLNFLLELSSFKHTGIFPEQSSNWSWIMDVIRKENIARGANDGTNAAKVSVLNLFGYTGGATLAAASAGAEVCHVDASKVSIVRAKKNAALSGLSDAPIRFILDDALAFVKREARRGKKYDAIIMDPPSFGRGPKGEIWKVEKDLPELITACRKILADKPVFALINGYAAGYSPITYLNNLKLLIGADMGNSFNVRQGATGQKMSVEYGELAIKESGDGRLLPAGIFARASL